VNARRELVYRVLRAVRETRRRAGVAGPEAICIYDICGHLGLEVRFVDMASLEGLYLRRPSPTVIVSSLRPAGRRAFTTAHEVGHHVLGHGDRLDAQLQVVSDHAYIGRRTHPEEAAADLFGGLLLMPPGAVRRAFAVRGLDPAASSPGDLFAVASWFGVGYGTLVHHLSTTLRTIPSSRAKMLRREQPKQLRSELVGYQLSGELVVVDEHWTGRPVDIEVGSHVLVPSPMVVDGRAVEIVREADGQALLRGATPGIGRICGARSGWATFIRVSRAGYVGRAAFRHLEDPDVG
jgi:hypothetical protein